MSEPIGASCALCHTPINHGEQCTVVYRDEKIAYIAHRDCKPAATVKAEAGKTQTMLFAKAKEAF